MRNILLLIIGIVLTVMAIGFFQTEKEESYASSEEPIFADFSLETLNSLTKIVIQREGEKTEIKRSPRHGWEVSELAGYPADINKIRKLLQEILEAKTIEQKTDDSRFYGELGVKDPQDPGAKNILFGMYGEDQWQLIIGKPGNKIEDARFVRIYGQDEVRLINRSLEVPEKALDWVDNLVLSLLAGDIREIRITGGDHVRPLLIQREQALESLSIVSLPSETTVNENALNEISYLVDPLNFLDVKRRESSRRDMPGSTIKAVYESFNGQVVTIEAHMENSQPWLAISSTALATADAANQLEAKSRNRRLQSWIYRVTDKIYADLRRKEGDYLVVE